MSEEDEKHFRTDKTCWFCEKGINSNKVRDQCHVEGLIRGPAHQICNISVAQKQSNFNPFGFHNFGKYDCHLLFQNFT